MVLRLCFGSLFLCTLLACDGSDVSGRAQDDGDASHGDADLGDGDAVVGDSEGSDGDGDGDEQDACSASGQTCELGVAQAPPWVCHAEVGGGVCRQSCEVSAGEADPCPAGSVCGSDGTTTACVPGSCLGFFSGGCEQGEKCAPIGNQSYVCLADGWLPDGSGCSIDAECGAGLLCLRGACLAPQCAPLSGEVSCGAAEACIAYVRGGEELDLGSCCCTEAGCAEQGLACSTLSCACE